jgi:hypothetical protein
MQLTAVATGLTQLEQTVAPMRMVIRNRMLMTGHLLRQAGGCLDRVRVW